MIRSFTSSETCRTRQVSPPTGAVLPGYPEGVRSSAVSAVIVLPMARTLPNYLRMYRKRSGLHQNEAAFLLGWADGGRVSRHELSAQRPSIETLLAYEHILGVPIRELYAGTYEKVAQEITPRARILARKLSARETRPHARASELVSRIASWPRCESRARA
jgi:transcriptional regulator with XRE-family HTH domain